MYSQLKTGDIVAVATDIDGLDVTHTGLVYRNADLFAVAKKYAELNQKDKTVEILSKILQVSDLDDSYKASYIDAVAKIYFSIEFPSRV